MRIRPGALLAILPVLASPVPAPAALDGAAILARARAVIDAGGDLSAHFTLEVRTPSWRAARRGRFYKHVGAAGRHTLIVFDEPAQVHDVKVLSRRPAHGAAQAWLWMPTTGRARRVASGSAGRSLLGGDFSLNDLEQRDPGLRNTLLRRERRRGHETFVVEIAGRERDRPVHEILWVRSDDFRVARREFYEHGVLARVYTAARIRTIDGVPTPVAMTIVSPPDASRSRIRLHRVRHQAALDPRRFTVAELERRLAEDASPE